jgi:hypothetical protein
MTKSILKFSLLSLMTLAVVGLPGRVGAQEHQTPPVEKKEAKEKKQGTLPFHGKLKAVDTTAKTITVGELTFHITAETKMTKGSAAATLADAKVGENVNGAYRKVEDGSLQATKIHLGAKEGSGHPKRTEPKPNPTP